MTETGDGRRPLVQRLHLDKLWEIPTSRIVILFLPVLTLIAIGMYNG